MSRADEERMAAEALPAGGVVSVLLEEHAKIRDLFAQTAASTGEERQRAFDELRELLAVHEAGEEMVVRPVSKRVSNGAIADARDAEEAEAATALAELEKLAVDTPQFTEKLAAFERAVGAHADAEEREELPYLLETVDPDEQVRMGTRLLDARRLAPTHAHPMTAGNPLAQKTIGPFVALLDRARDAFDRVTTSR